MKKKEKKKKWCDVTKKRVRKREEESKCTMKFHYLETMKYHSIVLVLDFVGFKWLIDNSICGRRICKWHEWRACIIARIACWIILREILYLEYFIIISQQILNTKLLLVEKINNINDKSGLKPIVTYKSRLCYENIKI